MSTIANDPIGSAPLLDGDTAAQDLSVDAAAPSQLDADHDSHSLLAGDVVLTPDPMIDISDLHAAIVSVGPEAFFGLDLALDHLTSATDLFDIPAIDFGDVHHE